MTQAPPAGQGNTFVDVLALEPLEENLFRGWCHAGAPLRAFGGQVAAQSLVAAGKTVVPERAVHSLHSYFLLPGRPERPIVYHVDRVRDGQSFTTRRVTAVQGGETIFTLSASFQRHEVGEEHQARMPDVPDPDDMPDPYAGRLPADTDHRATSVMRSVLSVRFIEGRGVDSKPGTPAQRLWIKATVELPDDPLLHVCALTYLSDLTLAGTAIHQERFERKELVMASLDHAMWFHRPFRADEWLLFDQLSTSRSGNRGFTHGSFYTRDGRLVASAVQEALIRRRRQEP